MGHVRMKSAIGGNVQLWADIVTLPIAMGAVKLSKARLMWAGKAAHGMSYLPWQGLARSFA